MMHEQGDGTTDYRTHLADLLAYIVINDSNLSGSEVESVSALLDEYDQESASVIFNRFLVALKERPDFSEILRHINETFSNAYNEKIDLILKLYEITASDALKSEESALFYEICRALHITEKDTDLIASLLRVTHALEHEENRYRKIVFGEEPATADLIYSDINAEIVEVTGRYFFVNKDAKGHFFLDDVPLSSRRIIPLTGNVLSFGIHEIAVADVPLFFRLKREALEKEVHFAFIDDDDTKIALVDDYTKTDFSLNIKGTVIRLYPNLTKTHDTISLKVNGREVLGIESVNLSDTVLINNRYYLPLRAILFAEENIRAFHLEKADYQKDSFVISSTNDVKPDFFVETLGEATLFIEITKRYAASGIRFLLHTVTLPSDVYLDGKAIGEGEEHEVAHPARLRVGMRQFILNTDTGEVEDFKIRFDTLTVKNLSYAFRDGTIACDEVSFRAKSGELNCIMGPSGSGKSTLVKLLLGNITPDEGEVRINGYDLYRHFHQIKQFIGYVPQEDLLLENLTVYENLYYAVKIRMPKKPQDEIDALVTTTLKELGLYEKRNLKVGNPAHRILSGGQRKRLNIGIELISNPDLFFLDEPTSGLSSKDSETIIELLENLAQKGKIIFAIIHQPGSRIYRKFNNLLLLDVGGKLAYYGNTIEALRYFSRFRHEHAEEDAIKCPMCGTVHPEEIFTVLEEKSIGKDGFPVYKTVERKERGPSRMIQNMVKRISPALYQRMYERSMQARRYEPEYWKKLFLSKQVEQSIRNGENENGKHDTRTEETFRLPPPANVDLISRLRVSGTFILRSLKNNVNDASNILMMLFVSVGLGFLMSYFLRGGTGEYVFRENEDFLKYLFLSTIIVIFIGTMASVNRVVEDRALFMRERIMGISPWQYVLGKVFVFLIFAIPQIILYFAIGVSVLHVPVSLPPAFAGMPIPGPALTVYIFILSLALAFAAYALGLFVSSFLQSENAASTATVLIIIPQIVLGGLFIEYNKMPNPRLINTPAITAPRDVPVYSDAIFARWAYEGFVVGSVVFSPDERLRRYRGTLKPTLVRKRVALETKSPGYFDEFAPNTKTLNTLREQNIPSWDALVWGREHGEAASALEWFVRYAVFPARNKVFGSFVFDTVWFNIVVLILQGMLLNVLTVMKLRGEEG